jgi:hypothetical protein
MQRSDWFVNSLCLFGVCLSFDTVLGEEMSNFKIHDFNGFTKFGSLKKIEVMFLVKNSELVNM